MANNMFKKPPGSDAPSEAGPGTGDNATSASTAMEKAAVIQQDMIAAIQKKEREEMESMVRQLDSLDWKKIPPPIMAIILTKIPRRAKRDEPEYYLTYNQALVFAIEAYRMDLSPLSSQVFIIPKSWQVKPSLEGKKEMSRSRGYNFGPPKFDRLERPWPRGKESIGRIFNWEKDVAYRCSMQIKGFDDRCEYTAWMSEWFQSSSDVWRDKPDHMLQVRSQEKCISSASGVGISDMPGPEDLEPPIMGRPVLDTPVIEATKFVEAKE